MSKVNADYLDDVFKLETYDSDSQGRWRGLDDLLGQAQPSNLLPLDMDMNDLLDFEPCPVRHKSETPIKQLKQDSPNPDTIMTPEDEPDPDPRASPALPSPAASPTHEYSHEVIDLTDETPQPQVKQEPKEERKVSLNDLREIQRISSKRPLRPLPSVSRNVKAERSEDMSQNQTLSRKRPLAALHISARDLESKQDVAKYRAPPPAPNSHNVPRATTAIAVKPVSKRDLGQRTFLKKSKLEPEPDPFLVSNLTSENAISTLSQGRGRKAIREEHPMPAFKSSHDEETLAQAASMLGLTYLDDLREILPETAPAGHPHLISIADHALSEMISIEMVGLSLPDVVVSILYTYASDPREVITKFLDKDKTNHFFFIFSSRTDKWHSWSIEREESRVTVGIERRTRPPNDKSQSPSNGLTDFYLQYELKRNLKHISPRFNLLAGLMPRNPAPREFLFNTSTVRVAQQHAHYSTRHQPPADGIRALAQYMWFSAFRASAMEAEFQLAYGRKVRYDNVIGRIRATYDNALKGAKTQALKRAQGLYNVPTRAVDGSMESSRKRKSEDAMADIKEEYDLEGEGDYE